MKIQKPRRRPYLEGPPTFHHRNPRPWVSPVFLLQIESSSNTSKNGVSASPFIQTKGPTSDFNQSRRERRRIILFVLGKLKCKGELLVLISIDF
ncbi:hypothetical protein RchiOBHm_Chr4g0399791 [Rosa chinensis]|uniref:Uncharacterized protein n=1 Tax=Rosa chinensis TaxID=74649 RepID=A0A2P6QSQ2_ROSCH|nr:hypothetical protein RchiOBHm_Chr4g0399791 [Rosa chinensis]